MNERRMGELTLNWAHLLDLIEQIRDRLGASQTPMSSVEIHDSTRGFDVDVKCYGTSSDTLLQDIGDAAMQEYVRIKLTLKGTVEQAFDQEVQKRINNR